jgi:lectin, mannose-binding 2
MKLLTRILAWISIIATILYGQAAELGNPGRAGASDEGGQKVVPLKTHSLSAPYLDSDLQSRWYLIPWMLLTLNRWEFGGDTVVDANKYITI